MAVLGAVLGAAALVAAPAVARHEKRAEVRARAAGGEAVWVDGRVGWPEPAAKLAPEITTDLVWSKRRDAVAFVAREDGGAQALVVVLVEDGTGPVALSWPIPKGDTPMRKVMWLGPQRVGAGPAELEPRVVASWKTSRR